ncbi:RnfH family protein [Legionella drancourtii]|uniref:RnfH family protein n=1 Tax=Legionella drancourtii TaxID=168933 RepID=UPI00030E67B5|nr:RnfH family protein [Legionella drancourtii]
MLKIELVYVTLERQTVHLTLTLNSGATVLDALNASKIYHSHPETKNMAVGIYAKQVVLDAVLKDGDRVEIYRPLVLDPKEKRRQLARSKK